jgi:hypothetical protein
MRVNVYINNEQVNDPNNLNDLAISLNYDKDVPTAQVSLTEWNFGVGNKALPDGAVKTNEHIAGGLTGGVGALEGVPFRVELEHRGEAIDVFNGYLDLLSAEISCDRLTATAVETGGIDWLSDVADSKSFEYMYDNGEFTDADFVSIPYVINSIPKAGESFLLLLTAFVVTQTIKQEIQALAEMSVETSNPISAIGGVLKIALRVLYIATLLVSIIKLVLDAVNLIIQPVKYHKGMYAYRLLEIGAKSYGFNSFQSSILKASPFNKMVIIPNQFDLPEDSNGIFGFKDSKNNTKGYFNGSMGDLLQIMRTMYNGKILVRDNVLRFERKDYNPSSAVYQVPPVEIDSYRLNGEDFISNLYIEFAYDINDKNTIKDYAGTSAQSITLPIKSNNPQMVLSKGFEKRSIPFALAKVKTELTAPEKIVKALATVVDPLVGGLVKLINGIIKVVNEIIKLIKKIINALNKLPGVNINFNPKPIKTIKWTPLKDLIDNRIGMMMLENDFIDVAKVLLIDEATDPRYTKINANNRTVLNAQYLFNNYHFIDSFDPKVYAQTNQHKLYNIDKVPFCFDDFKKVRQNNRIFDSEGRSGVVDGLEWNILGQTAKINYRINEIWTRNIQTKTKSTIKNNPFI